MTSSLEDEVRRVLAGMDNQNSQEQDTEIPGTPEQEPQPEETIQIHYFPDAIVILKEEEPEDTTVVETTLAQTRTTPVFIGYAVCLCYFFLICSTLAFQLYLIQNPSIATITIIPKSQTVTLTGTLQLGRLVNPITISQSQTVPATGKGHQDARSATGFITFYNGLFTSQTIAAGTIFTGADGIQISTDQEAIIPAGNPPSYGQVTVSAHSINPGVRGNIPAYDINQACCSSAVLAKNIQPFTGGQNERNFQTVSKNDITSVSSPLKTAVAQSMSGALQGQATAGEQLFILPCSPTVTSDHRPGEEAKEVKVTVSETCGAVVYERGELEKKAAALLTHQAAIKIGSGYSLIEDVQTSVKQATVSHTPTPRVFLSFEAQGSWVYALNHTAQEQIKTIIAGKTKQEALHLLQSLPGIERVSIAWGDDTRLPKISRYIHVVMLITAV